MKNKGNILVTGGAGYVGCHACKALVAAGFTPVTLDNLVRGHEWAVKWGPLEVGDVTDSRRVTDVIKKYRPVGVMHFAAFAYVGESVEHPEKYYANNVVGSFYLLQALERAGIRNIVFLAPRHLLRATEFLRLTPHCSRSTNFSPQSPVPSPQS